MSHRHWVLGTTYRFFMSDSRIVIRRLLGQNASSAQGRDQWPEYMRGRDRERTKLSSFLKANGAECVEDSSGAERERAVEVCQGRIRV